jgi:hypothetical protein
LILDEEEDVDPLMTDKKLSKESESKRKESLGYHDQRDPQESNSITFTVGFGVGFGAGDVHQYYDDRLILDEEEDVDPSILDEEEDADSLILDEEEDVDPFINNYQCDVTILNDKSKSRTNGMRINMAGVMSKGESLDLLEELSEDEDT